MVVKLALSSFILLSIVTFSKGLDLDSAVEHEKQYLLFESEEALMFTLIMDIKTVRNDDSDDPQYSNGHLILHNDGADDMDFNIKVKARGHSRRLFDFCYFPPLKLNFKKKEVKGTVFDGQDKLKLVSYCKDTDLFQDYVFQEYLIYKMYNLLTLNSFKVRLAKITYKDLNDKTREIVRYGFLIEDEDLMATRIGGAISEALMSNHDRCERNTLDLFTMFQFMIGNTDWWMSRPKIHNVKLVVHENKTIIPVPYDFDYCGAINANYAVPPEELPIKSVRERYFRGYCRLPGTYERIVEMFNNKKEEIYDLYHNFDLLNESKKKIILRYYDDFFKQVNNPKLLEREVYDMCELSHDHLHELKTRK